MKPSSATPLSDLIAELGADDSPEAWVRFIDAFRKSQVGVIVVGLPADATGEVVATADRPLKFGLTNHAGGRRMVLAFADPAAFAARFGQKFNAAMTGAALLATMQSDPDCQGVLVNSALEAISVVIDRDRVKPLILPDGA